MQYRSTNSTQKLKYVLTHKPHKGENYDKYDFIDTGRITYKISPAS